MKDQWNIVTPSVAGDSKSTLAVLIGADVAMVRKGGNDRETGVGLECE